MNNTHPTPKQGARWWIMCMSLMFCAILHAQNKIEYFWNTDPGIGKGTKVAVTNGVVDTSLPAESLAVGPNLLGIRAIDGDNYSSTLLRTVLRLPVFAEDAKVEYFWDEDPGVGNAAKYPVTLSGKDVMVDLNIAVEDVSNGMHLLGIRVFNGYWSHTHLYMVAVAKDGGLANTVEYYWDNDPGVGQATKQTLVADGTSAVAELEIPADTLNSGVHLLGIRVGADGAWSSTLTRFVAVASRGSAVESIEYFWDSDPGIGSATKYAISSSDNQASVTFEVSADSLSPGIHLLGIRSFCGQWSSTSLHYVAVSAKGGAIERVEYYWDTDPGYGQATELPFSGDSVATVNTEIVPPTEYGTHVLTIRALSNGVWSTPYVQKFCMNAIPGMELPKDTFCVGEKMIVANMTEGATDATTYSWDMNGDGVQDSDSGEEFVYSYTKPGNYMASLSVKTVGECVSTCYQPVVVLSVDAPKVSLSASSKTVCDGDVVCFRANASNAGDNPEFDWMVNGEVVATTSADTLLLGNLQNSDKVQVRVLASNPCAQVDNAVSSQITMRVNPLPEVSLAHYFPLYTSESSIILSGGLPDGGTYYINGEEASLFNPKRNDVGEYQLTYSYTNGNGCTSEVTTVLQLLDAAMVLGDVNKDGTVNVMDVLCEVDLVYGRIFPTYTLLTADINADKTINVADVVGVSGIILGEHAVAKAVSAQQRISKGVADRSVLKTFDSYAEGRSEVLLNFALSSASSACGMQFDVTLPEGVGLTSSTQGLVVGRKPGTKENTYTLLAYSSSLNQLPGTLSVVASLPVNLAEGGYPIIPENVVLVDALMNELPCELSGGKLFVGSSTGMNGVNAGVQVNVTGNGLQIIGAAGKVATLYDMSGRFQLAEELSSDDCLVSLMSLPVGTYVVEIETENSPIKVKFLWKR